MENKSIKTEKEIRKDIVEDYKTSMFVEAGAGAGKTTILIKRILKQLEMGFAKTSEIVAITFTKKAAEEMKVRMAQSYSGDDLDNMQISTIHSFCFKLLMEQAFKANLRLDVAMLEEDENDAEKDEIFARWYKNIKPSDFRILRELNIYKIKDLLKSAFNIMSDLDDDIIVDINEKLLKHKPSDFPIAWKKNDDGTFYYDNYGRKKEEPYDDRNEYIANFVVNFVMPLVKEYKNRINNHYISNDLLLYKAVKLLKNDDARAYYQKKYRCIYVDEFQDTSKVQVDLVKLLCTKLDGSHREGSLFIVGDPKQSIYRFRGADLPLYNKVKDEFKNIPNIKYYELNYNFRTNEEILSFVNANNDEILPNYHYMVSKSSSNDYKGDDVIKGVFHIGSPLKIRRKSKDHDGYNKETDIKYLIAIINGLVYGKFKIWDKDINDGKGAAREAKYSDFLILCRGTGDMDLYMSEMMKYGIPVQISSVVNTNDNKELMRIRNICKYFAYPYDRRSIEGFISTVSKSVVNKYNRDELNKVIDVIKNDTKEMDAYSKLLYVAHNYDLYFDGNVTIEVDRAKRITTQVEQMVETILSTCDNNEMSVYEGVDNFVKNGYEREITLEDDANAVRFMNLHKAKGLEGKIVIVCKRSEKAKENNGDLDTYHYEDKNGVHYAVSHCISGAHGDRTYYPVYIKNENIIATVLSEQNEENNRLAYVEVTRSMEVLIVLNRVANTPLLCNYNFDSARNLFEVYPKLSYYLENDTYNNRELKPVDYKENTFEIKVDDRQKEITYNSISPSQFESEETIVTDEKNPSKVKGATYGTCMHRLFELIVNAIKKKVALTDDKIKVLINKVLNENLEAIEENFKADYPSILDDFKVVLLEDAQLFMDSFVVKDLLKNTINFHAEYPFMIKQGNDLCNGIADLFIENHGGTYTIVDYKSDYPYGMDKEAFKETLYKRYSGQLNMYKEVFAKVYGVGEDSINFVIYNKYI